MSSHIISVLMENEAGALSRLVGLFSARAYNIESLCVSTTEDKSLSRLTLLTSGNEQVLEQIIKQLNKLVDVVKVIDLSQSRHIEREIMLIKLDASESNNREELKRLSDIFRGSIIDVADEVYTIQVTGSSAKNDAFLKSFDEKLIIETVRSGVIGIQRGQKALTA